MKYLKKFENLNMLKSWNMILSDSDFKTYAEMFDEIVDIFVDYTDLGYEMKFETAYGSKVVMTYEDYIDKNEKYQEFIHGLPARGLFFTLSIRMPYDFENFINILNDVNSNSKRLESMEWVIKSFNVNGEHVSKFTWSKPFIRISYEFESVNKPKSNDWQVN
jgi:hypothetical protein